MKSNIASFRTIIQKDGKAYHGFVPALSGCHTQGDTIEETKNNLREAIELWIESRLAHKLPIPQDDSLESIETIDLSSFSYA